MFQIKIKMMVPLKETHAVEVFQSGGQYIFVNDRPIKFKELEKVYIVSCQQLISFFKLNDTFV